MKKKYTFKFAFFWLYFLLTLLKLSSQDIIVFKNGDEVQSKVMEVSTDLIKYKKWDNQNGPTYSSNKGDVFMIKYQNGTKDVFKSSETQTNPKPNENSSKIVEIAQQFMSNQISSESKGACKLVEFNKQNGVEKDIFGQKIYTLEYRLAIELQRDFWKASGDKLFEADWYWANFYVLDKKGDVYAETFTNNFAYFTKETRIEITGVIDFENTDNGWRVTGGSMFSNGYKNKTSRVLTSIKKEDSKPTKPLLKEKLPFDPSKAGYEGDMKDGKKNGKGRMVYENGNVYEGEWKEGEKNGQGKFYIYKEGITYEGEWKNDKKEGYGTITWDDGYINYQGGFKNGVPDGQGTTYDKGKKVYDGEWKNGKKDGKGTLIIRSEDGTLTYTGDFLNDKFNGQGSWTVIGTGGNITSNTGYFVNGELEGQGTETMKFSDGGSATFQGDFKNGEKFNGIQYLTSVNGKKGSIEFKNGKKGKMKKG